MEKRKHRSYPGKRCKQASTKKLPPISLLPICGKISERLIFNETFSILLENNLVSPNQFGSKPGDSCINQPLNITHEIFQSS